MYQVCSDSHPATHGVTASQFGNQPRKVHLWEVVKITCESAGVYIGYCCVTTWRGIWKHNITSWAPVNLTPHDIAVSAFVLFCVPPRHIHTVWCYHQLHTYISSGPSLNGMMTSWGEHQPVTWVSMRVPTWQFLNIQEKKIPESWSSASHVAAV